MSVVSANEQWEARSGSDDGKTRTYVRSWQVFTSSKWDGPKTASVHSSIPRVGAAHPDDYWAFVDKLDVKQDGELPTKWTVTANYSTDKKDEDPLKDPVKISWSTESYQTPFVVDRNGNGVVNKAGDPFDPPYIIDDQRLVANVVKNVANVPTWVLLYRNVLNSDTFNLDGLSVAPGKAKVVAIGISEQQQRNDIQYRTLTIPIHLNESGWVVSILNAGFFYYTSLLTHAKGPCTINGKSVSVPVLLDLNGQQQLNPAFNTATFCDFDAYAERPFSILPLT